MPQATNTQAHSAVVSCLVSIMLSFRCSYRMWVEFILRRWTHGFYSNSVGQARNIGLAIVWILDATYTLKVATFLIQVLNRDREAGSATY